MWDLPGGISRAYRGFGYVRYELEGRLSETIGLSGEYGITDSINALADDLDIGYSMLGTWIDIGRPWNLLDANEYLLAGNDSEIAGVVEPYATLNSNIRVGNGSIIRNGSYIT
uniref:Bifunctional protein GlmU n=1 Tax=Candidatus Methanogaster sp. ANME-2c ERB4 TaxID=2759911 RepID=A0A7G9YLB4_9EURY|nr:hypothetical protein IMBEDNDK_00008 [Methanosarcinales archaeon ANME-2c ERB4]